MQYHVHDLVYHESTSDVNGAITREKQLKKWEQASKIRLMEESNPRWKDLYPQLGRRYRQIRDVVARGLDSRCGGNDIAEVGNDVGRSGMIGERIWHTRGSLWVSA